MFHVIRHSEMFEISVAILKFWLENCWIQALPLESRIRHISNQKQYEKQKQKILVPKMWWTGEKHFMTKLISWPARGKWHLLGHFRRSAGEWMRGCELPNRFKKYIFTPNLFKINTMWSSVKKTDYKSGFRFFIRAVVSIKLLNSSSDLIPKHTQFELN